MNRPVNPGYPYNTQANRLSHLYPRNTPRYNSSYGPNISFPIDYRQSSNAYAQLKGNVTPPFSEFTIEKLEKRDTFDDLLGRVKNLKIKPWSLRTRDNIDYKRKVREIITTLAGGDGYDLGQMLLDLFPLEKLTYILDPFREVNCPSIFCV